MKYPLGIVLSVILPALAVFVIEECRLSGCHEEMQRLGQGMLRLEKIWGNGYSRQEIEALAKMLATRSIETGRASYLVKSGPRAVDTGEKYGYPICNLPGCIQMSDEPADDIFIKAWNTVLKNNPH